MPTRRIDKPEHDVQKYCRDSDHEVPNMMYFENGTYEHTCSACGKKQVFHVNRPTL